MRLKYVNFDIYPLPKNKCMRAASTKPPKVFKSYQSSTQPHKPPSVSLDDRGEALPTWN
jgi:hypothetical protein